MTPTDPPTDDLDEILETMAALMNATAGQQLYIEDARDSLLKWREEADGCPCVLVSPCSYACSCANSNMSGGCMRCCKYGSPEQRLANAHRLVNAVVAGRIDEAENLQSWMGAYPVGHHFTKRIAELKKQRGEL